MRRFDNGPMKGTLRLALAQSSLKYVKTMTTAHRLQEGPKVNGFPSAADLLSDSAVYKRTPRGQRELLRVDDPAATPALRLLSRVNGYTELRRLIDLAPGDAASFAHAIPKLLDDHLIELVDPDAPDA